MNCTECRELLVAHVEESLENPQQEQVVSHLKDCRECRAELAELTHLRDRLITRGEVLAEKKLEDVVIGRIIREQSLKLKTPGKIKTDTSIWRIIMRNRIAQVATAAVIAAALVGIYLFSSSIDGTGVIFADVLTHIQNSSYAFDLTIAMEKQASTASTTVRAMVLEPGRMRLEAATGLGKVSTIVDISEGETLMLFHQEKAAIMEVPSEGRYAEFGSILALLAKPIENLWDLRDGTEEKLGEKEIEGQTVNGFKILQKDQHFQHTITIWAATTTNVPVLVEMLSTSLDDSSKSLKFIMNKFDVGVEFDKELFRVHVPAGYTLAYQLDLDELGGETTLSPEAKKIKGVLTLWSEGKKNEAIMILMAIDWAKPLTFSRKPYLFTITEKEFISLKHEDQQYVITEIMDASATVRDIARELVKLGKEAFSTQDYKRSEHCFETALRMGRLLTQDSDYMLIARLVGIAVQKVAVQERIRLYTTTNDQQKLQAAKSDLESLEAEQKSIKRKASGK